MPVHLKISDRNWILETMARNLASRLDYVSYDTSANPQADIQYYMTYSTYRGRVSPIELAYFTHLEEDPAVAKRFFAAAEAVDASVCMSRIYADILQGRGIEQVHVIPPGVDLETFDVKLRIGVVGRTYVTGRKGEALMAEVMDTPGVEFLFTGDGWPLPGLHLTDAEVPGFYRSLDYVLVPARYEGGPMSAIEALACGVEVIAPPVGWMPELPHIPYKLNDASDLRRVLSGLVEARRTHRAAVMDRSWDAWATAHDALFRKLLPAAPKPIAVAALQRARSVRIVTHGMETVARGGPSTRVPQLDAGLKTLGYDSARGNYGSLRLEGADLYHLFNVATPKTAQEAMAGLKSFGRPVVFSPIYLDNRYRNIWSQEVPAIFSTPHSLSRKLSALKQLHNRTQLMRDAPIRQDRTLPPSYHQGITRLLEVADEVIYLSNWERMLLSDATGVAPQGHVVVNPVQTAPFRTASPEAFRAAFGVENYVLCVGRIEPRKNQLVLAAALSGSGIPLVLAGACFDTAYLELLRAIPDLVLIETGHLASGSDMLLSAFAGCSVFCLPSWSEGAPIAALEAAAAGCQMVLSTYSSESEYFGDRATYVGPADVLGLRAALQDAHGSPRDRAGRAEMSDFIEDHFSVERHVERTRDVYETLLARGHALVSPRTSNVLGEGGRTVYFDITTLLNNPGRVTGITRVELSLTRAARPEDDVQFIAWHADRNFYFFVDEDLRDFAAGPNYRQRADLRRVEILPANAPLLLQGNAWLRNSRYVMALERLVRSSNLRLTMVIHDILPISKPQYFEPKQAEHLIQNLDRLVPLTSTVCAVSQATRRDLEAYFSTRLSLAAPITVIRQGDGLDDGLVVAAEAEAGVEEENGTVATLLEGGSFVLSVGSQLPHKNRNLLLHIWNRLVDDLGEKAPTLVIVGKINPGQQDYILDPATRSKVVTLQALDDAHLNQLYEQCLFTVFPSLCEGWGLPVAESLAYGKVCISSDTFSMPEIAPECTDLIDPLDTMAWYRQIRLYVTSAERRHLREAEITASFQPTQWRDTLEHLFATARNAPTSSLAPTPWDFEMRFDATDLNHRARLAFAARDGKQGDEPASTSVVFALTSFSDAPVLMDVLCGSKTTGAVEVLLNGEIIDTLIFDRAPETVHSILLPGQSGTQHMELMFREIGEVGFKLLQFVLLRSAPDRTKLFPQAMLKPVSFPPEKQIKLARDNSQAHHLLVDGWHRPEGNGVWSERHARLHLPLAELSGGALRVTVDYVPLVSGPVFIDVAGIFGTVIQRNSPLIEIPAWVVARLGSYLDLGLTVPQAASPKTLGTGSDQRILGLRLRTLNYTEVPAELVSRPDQEDTSALPFGKFLGDGWHPPEPTHVWSTGVAQLTILAAQARQSKLVLRVQSLTDQKLHIFADGQHVLSVDLTANRSERIVLPQLTSGELNDDIDLTLTSSIVTSPAELKISSDRRRLGISLEEVIWDDSALPSVITSSSLVVADGPPDHNAGVETSNHGEDAAGRSDHYTQRVKAGLRTLLRTPKKRRSKRQSE